MKPLKYENEVASKVKSTAKYAFVAPGAIGKGRGRGLRSMLSLGMCRSDIPLSPSTEASNIEKGRGQGLRSMSNVQGVQTTSRNSLVLEKGLLQSFSSTDEVMKYIQANSTSASRPLKSIRSATHLTAQGLETMNKTLSVREKEQMKTDGKNLISIGDVMSSTQTSETKLQTTNKRPLVHDKENIQNDIPNSPTDQVKPSTQTVETDSRATEKR